MPSNVVGKQLSGLAIISLVQSKGSSWGQKAGFLEGPSGQEAGSQESNKAKQICAVVIIMLVRTKCLSEACIGIGGGRRGLQNFYI